MQTFRSAECWLGALVQNIGSDDKQMELKIVNKKDAAMAKKLRIGKSTVTVKAVAESLVIGEPIVVAYKTTGDQDVDDDEPPHEHEVGRTEVYKATANPKFKEKILTIWEYDPTDKMIFRVYYAAEEEDEKTAGVIAAEEMAGNDGKSETEASSSEDESDATSEDVPPNGQYIGFAKCTYKDLMERCDDGGLNLTLSNELSDMLAYVFGAVCFVYTCRRLCDRSLVLMLSVFVHTCRRLIDLSLLLCIYMPAIDRPLSAALYIHAGA